jgi:hypothetical protein
MRGASEVPRVQARILSIFNSQGFNHRKGVVQEFLVLRVLARKKHDMLRRISHVDKVLEDRGSRPRTECEKELMCSWVIRTRLLVSGRLLEVLYRIGCPRNAPRRVVSRRGRRYRKQSALKQELCTRTQCLNSYGDERDGSGLWIVTEMRAQFWNLGKQAGIATRIRIESETWARG